jgi:predicted ArsR family transcriptional regulator
MRSRPKRRGVTPEQREALTSPLRLEILGQFTEATPLSVRDLAERMGRTPHSIYYHVHLLARVGLLREVGPRAGGAGRSEALYRPVRDTIALDFEPGAEDSIRRTMAAAFRMTLRDLDTALESADPRRPADPPGLATRLHFRGTPGMVKQVRRHLLAAVELVQREARRDAGRGTGSMYSLTLALLPLRGRSKTEGDG